MPAHLENLIGQKFGRLTVAERSYTKRTTAWNCICECGKSTIVTTKHLKSGQTKSCGCLNHEPKYVKHNLAHTKLYSVYIGMKRRCYSSEGTHFKDYYQKGIKICKEWLGDNGFENFYKWAMANGFSEELTIDRKDNNGNYTPENCRWATPKEQVRNRNITVKVNYKGQEYVLAELAEKHNIPYATLYDRVKKGTKEQYCFVKDLRSIKEQIY